MFFSATTYLNKEHCENKEQNIEIVEVARIMLTVNHPRHGLVFTTKSHEAIYYIYAYMFGTF